ncbi:MAG: exodeoxyribonuclease VII small subunit [Clostridiaceae bacterium]|nr:exodeoxyribonuclease VII small subunit [Clostridiaceae bacterium]
MPREKMNFENSMNELEGIVNKLERGELSLDESIGAFQKGIQLSKQLSRMLDEVEKKITLLIEDEKGNLMEENFNKIGENDGF